jgi:hypothetical protein
VRVAVLFQQVAFASEQGVTVLQRTLLPVGEVVSQKDATDGKPETGDCE